MKRITLTLLLLLVPLLSFGQENKNINRSFNTNMERLFGNLEKERVPTGILLDFGMEFTNVPAFDGTLTDSTYVSPIRLKRIYKTLLTSRIREVNEGFVRAGQFSETWQQARSSEYIVLSGLYFKYDRFSENAYPKKINFDGEIISDKYVEGVWQNPYQTSEIFAMSPPLALYKGLEMQVKLPRSIFRSNDAESIQSIQIDFSDGKGYRPLEYDQLLQVQYVREGVKIWKYKLIRNNGETMFAQSLIKIENRVSLSTDTECSGLYAVNLTADLDYLDQYGEVTITVDRADGNCYISKPLIVAEGFDVGTLLNPENIYGTSNITTFYSDIEDSQSFNLRQLLTGSTETIYNDQEYDIIYVDWKNGVDYLQRNAYALEKVIEYVNNVKVGNEPNVVLGQSMGGVIARYALADMEVRGLDHETRLFISHDAPQQGANIPLSFQFMYRHLTNQYIESSTTLFGGLVTVPLLEDLGAGTYLSLMDAPASRQLLMVWSSLNYNMDNSLHNSFYNELQNLNSNNGYPQDPNIRNIAISNGSECGNTQTLVPYETLLSFELNHGLSFWGDLASLIYNPLGGIIGGLFLDEDFFGVGILGVLPGNSRYIIDFDAAATGYGTNKIYHGLVRYKKKIFGVFSSQVTITEANEYQPNGVLPFDMYGGGYFSLESISSNIGEEVYIADRFGFIPTISALDIGKGEINLNDTDYKKEYVGGNPPIAPKNSPFDNFITAYAPNGNTNQLHISFQTRNGNWLAKELQANPNDPEYPPVANCSFLCDDPGILGNGALCDVSTYTVTNLATEVNWYITEGAEAVDINENGNAVILTKTDDYFKGNITLHVVYGNGKCSTTATRTIRVGEPDIYTMNADGTKNYMGGGATYSLFSGTKTIQVHTDAPNTTFSWEMSDPNTITWGSHGRTASFHTSIVGTYVFTAKATNECGTHMLFFIIRIEDNNDPNYFTVYPNPASGTLHIENSATNPAQNGAGFTLYDFQGNPVQDGSLNETVQLDVSTLSKGHYILKISSGNEIETHHIVVE